MAGKMACWKAGKKVCLKVVESDAELAVMMGALMVEWTAYWKDDATDASMVVW